MPARTPWRSAPATGYTPPMSHDDAYQTTPPTIAAGQAAVVTRLRTLATRLEGLSVEVATEVLLLIEPAVEAFERQAALALERAPLALDPSYGGIFGG